MTQHEGEHGAARVAYLLRRWGERGLLRTTLTVAGMPVLDAEPMVGGWWPLADAASVTAVARLQLSRFASLRRQGDRLVLESPRARSFEPHASAPSASSFTPKAESRCATSSPMRSLPTCGWANTTVYNSPCCFGGTHQMGAW